MSVFNFTANQLVFVALARFDFKSWNEIVAITVFNFTSNHLDWIAFARFDFNISK